jgi:frataxin-like iron-binding protein CyaY
MDNGGQVDIMDIDFRKKVDEVFQRLEVPFNEVDPDVAECEIALGSMTITLSDGSRCILSTQPSVRQLWLAVASKGVALSFQFRCREECMAG